MLNPLLIMTWFWKQNPPRADFEADKVNRWAEMMSANLTLPHRLACVTDTPDGIDGAIDIIPLSDVAPPLLMEMKGKGWDEERGLPQCYRRLAIWRPDAAEIFGAERLVSMDTDCIALGNLDSAFDHNHDLKLLKGTSAKRPYNGGLVQLKAGCRPHVYERINQRDINESRKRFVGSDQAWISHVLGWHEKRFLPEDGIYNWTPRFVNIHSGSRGFCMPDNARLMFFPNVVKPWHMTKTHPRIYAVWAGHDPGPDDAYVAVPTSKRTRLWAYDDPKGWGKAFQVQAKARNMRCWLFKTPETVAQSETAFVRLDQQGSQRDVSRGVIVKLSERGIVSLPTAGEALLYDDKIAQYPVLQAWMPETWIRTSREDAEDLLEQCEIEGAFPLISKSAEGAGSANVRVLANDDEAWAEIVTVFGTGRALKYGRIQTGYVYWQRIVPDNPCDYRVVITGDQAYGLVRINRKDTLFASGSGDNYPLTLKSEREIAAFDLAWKIADAIDTRWMAFDFVFDGDAPKVLEMSSAWTMQSYAKCPAYTRAQKPCGTGADSFKIAVDVLLEMAAARKRTAA